MNGDQSQAQICEVYRYDRFFTPDLVVWAHATDGCDVGTLAVCYLEEKPVFAPVEMRADAVDRRADAGNILCHFRHLIVCG